MSGERSIPDAELVAFLQWALPRLGMRWPGFRKVRGQVKKRLLRRLEQLELTDLGEYRARLERDADEWAVLDAACRITISRFHRDRRVFEDLRGTVLPALIAAARGRAASTLRCWSAGCASGEEPYTLALLHRFGLAPADRALPMTIVATDVEPHMIERARRACYPNASTRELPREWVEAAFEPSGDELCLRRELRETVELRCEDLRERMPDGPFDLVLCRYLALTYFDEPTQRAVLARIVARMVPGAALVVGTHEAPPDMDALERWPAVRSVWRRT